MVNSDNGLLPFLTPPICEDPCPANAFCPNSNEVYPKAGFSGIFSLEEPIVRCLNPFACLQGDETFPEQKCREGYRDLLCHDCVQEQSWKTMDSQFCNECPEDIVFSWFLYLGMGVLALVLVIGITQALMKSLLAKRQEAVPTLRIFISMCQILGILSGL